MILGPKGGRGAPRSVASAIDNLLSDTRGACGSYELLEAQVHNLQMLVIRYLAANITSVDQVNHLVGYEKYEEVKE